MAGSASMADPFPYEPMPYTRIRIPTKLSPIELDRFLRENLPGYLRIEADLRRRATIIHTTSGNIVLDEWAMAQSRAPYIEMAIPGWSELEQRRALEERSLRLAQYESGEKFLSSRDVNREFDRIVSGYPPRDIEARRVRAQTPSPSPPVEPPPAPESHPRSRAARFAAIAQEMEP